MLDPFSLVDGLSISGAECPWQSKDAGRCAPGSFTIDLAKRGRGLGCSPELHTEVSSELEHQYLSPWGFDRQTFLQGHHLYTIMEITKTYPPPPNKKKRNDDASRLVNRVIGAFLQNILSCWYVHNSMVYIFFFVCFPFFLENHVFLYKCDSLNVQNGKLSGWYNFSDSMEGDRRIATKSKFQLFYLLAI